MLTKKQKALVLRIYKPKYFGRSGNPHPCQACFNISKCSGCSSHRISGYSRREGFYGHSEIRANIRLCIWVILNLDKIQEIAKKEYLDEMLERDLEREKEKKTVQKIHDFLSGANKNLSLVKEIAGLKIMDKVIIPGTKLRGVVIGFQCRFWHYETVFNPDYFFTVASVMVIEHDKFNIGQCEKVKLIGYKKNSLCGTIYYFIPEKLKPLDTTK
jgi:hypothetical protein